MDLEEQIDREYSDLLRTVQRPNVLVAGATGAGKSSLVNAVFGADLAATGAGLPVTEHIGRHETPNTPIVLYDTVGYEIDADTRPDAIDEIVEFAAGRAQGDAAERMHLVWYVIDASRARVLDLDIELIDRLRRQHLPVAVVLAKADVASLEDLDALRHELLAIIPADSIFAVTTRPIPVMGRLELEGLCEWSARQLPDALRLAFAQAQRISLVVKRRRAMWVIAQHVGANFGIGWVPIPFSDAPLLVASQSAMIARLLFIYDLQALSSSLKAAYAIIGRTMVSALGVMTAASVLKLIPGVGTVVAGLINGSIAGVITQALGIAVVAVCSHAYELALAGRVDELEAFLSDTSRVLQDAFDGAKRDISQGGPGRPLLEGEGRGQ